MNAKAEAGRRATTKSSRHRMLFSCVLPLVLCGCGVKGDSSSDAAAPASDASGPDVASGVDSSRPSDASDVDSSRPSDASRESSMDSASGTGCPQGTALPDGCPDAPKGTPQFPNLLDTQSVVMLNIIPGSGYEDGTYDWSTTGGGGSGASGTVTVSGGQLGSSNSQAYTIAKPGSKYTSRPTVVVTGLSGGSGGSVTPSVYQATPHNAKTPWNMPGVDYYVGVPSGTTLKDPTKSGALPSGASYSAPTVTVTGCNVTLDAFDFTLHDTVVSVQVSGSSCTTTIQDSKFSANGSALEPIANLLSLGSGGSFVFQRNEYDGLAPIADAAGSGFMVNDPIQGGGTITLVYNYFHDFDSKVIQVSGTSSSVPFTEKYNLFADFGSCKTPPCSHGEAEYTYGDVGTTLSLTSEFNTYIEHFHTGSSDLTSLQAVQADAVNIDGKSDDHNVILGPGPQGTCNQYNANAYVAAAAVFDGQQEGGSLTNMSFDSNYIDNSGMYFAWYHATGAGVTHTNNIDSGGGGPCNCNTVNSDGSCD